MALGLKVMEMSSTHVSLRFSDQTESKESGSRVTRKPTSQNRDMGHPEGLDMGHPPRLVSAAACSASRQRIGRGFPTGPKMAVYSLANGERQLSFQVEPTTPLGREDRCRRLRKTPGNKLLMAVLPQKGKASHYCESASKIRRLAASVFQDHN
jgi:hypothetical protein